MDRLANFEVARNVRSPVLRVGARLAFGLACVAALLVVRQLVDLIAPGAGPFALAYPAVLLATLYGRWPAGVLTMFLSLWIAVDTLNSSAGSLPEAGPNPRPIVNFISLCILVVFTEAYRRAANHATAARDAEFARSQALLADLEHRTKNNFALVASLLEIQKRRQSDKASREMLDLAIGRIHSFAHAYSHLTIAEGRPDVHTDAYLTALVANLRDAAFPGNVTVTTDFAPLDLRAERAVAMGLLLNEALTNCAKYAFPDGRDGTVAVTTAVKSSKWELTVQDDGVGIPPSPSGAGLGSRLMETFAMQAGAKLKVAPANPGTVVRLSGKI